MASYSRKTTFFTLAVTGVLFFSIFVVFMFTSKPHQAVKVSSKTDAVNQTGFKDICDCAILVGQVGVGSVLNSETGLPMQYPPFAPGYTSLPFPYLAPSNTQLVTFSSDNKELSIRKGSDSVPHTLFSASGVSTLGVAMWSADETKLVVGTQVPTDMEPTESTWPTTFTIVDPLTGVATIIVTRDQVLKLHVTSMYPVAVSAGAKSIIFSSGDLSNMKYYFWSSTLRSLREVRLDIAGSIYLAQAKVDGPGYVLWHINNQLHRLQIDTLKEVTYPMESYSDAPVSKPSPDGQYVVYLKKVENEAAGSLTVLKLSDGKETKISGSPISSPGGFTYAFWSPDSKHLLLADQQGVARDWYDIQMDGAQREPKKLVHVPTLLSTVDNFVYGVIPLGRNAASGQ